MLSTINWTEQWIAAVIGFIVGSIFSWISRYSQERWKWIKESVDLLECLQDIDEHMMGNSAWIDLNLGKVDDAIGTPTYQLTLPVQNELTYNIDDCLRRYNSLFGKIADELLKDDFFDIHLRFHRAMYKEFQPTHDELCRWAVELDQIHREFTRTALLYRGLFVDGRQWWRLSNRIIDRLLMRLWEKKWKETIKSFNSQFESKGKTSSKNKIEK